MDYNKSLSHNKVLILPAAPYQRLPQLPASLLLSPPHHPRKPRQDADKSTALDAVISEKPIKEVITMHKDHFTTHWVANNRQFYKIV
jgi:hypothetical protein